MSKVSEFGLIGLGVMGKSLALNFLEKGISVSVYNRQVKGEEENIASSFASAYAAASGFDDLKEFALSLERPRKILIMVKAGNPVDDVIRDLMPYLSEGDILMDGGNSHYLDTRRRSGYLSVNGIMFLGIGISGGEEGARKGPSIMPGGATEGYTLVAPYLNAISAKDKDGNPCCSYIGRDGSGHFIKMVHNGIEYAEMQIIAEVYNLLTNIPDHNPERIREIFSSWQKEGLGSFLLEITCDILGKKEGDEYLLDKVLDAAEQKGTGGWSVQASLELGAPLTTISEAVNARIISSLKHERVNASKVYGLGQKPVSEIGTEKVKNAYIVARIINHALGFNLMQQASVENNWDLDFSEIARIWTNGCIIRSELMEKLKVYYKSENNLLLHPEIVSQLKQKYKDLSKVIIEGAGNNIPLPVLSSALTYFLGYTSANSPANLIQAQRDYFGAHSYRRIDSSENEYFHSNWKE